MDKIISTRDLIGVIMRSSFTLSKVVDSILKEKADISFSKLKILIALNRKPKISQKEIGEFLGITEAAVSRQIETMRKNGFIMNKKNNKNGKTTLVATTLGEVKLKKSLNLLDSFLEKSFRHINGKEKQKIVLLLDSFIKNIIDDNPTVFGNLQKAKNN